MYSAKASFKVVRVGGVTTLLTRPSSSKESQFLSFLSSSPNCTHPTHTPPPKREKYREIETLYSYNGVNCTYNNTAIGARLQYPIQSCVLYLKAASCTVWMGPKRTKGTLPPIEVVTPVHMCVLLSSSQSSVNCQPSFKSLLAHFSLFFLFFSHSCF